MDVEQTFSDLRLKNAWLTVSVDLPFKFFPYLKTWVTSSYLNNFIRID